MKAKAGTLARVVVARNRPLSERGEGYYMGLGLGKVDQGISSVDVVTDKP